MSCLGALFAIDDTTVAALCAAVNDAELMTIVRHIDDTSRIRAELDHAWDAIHRALTDGTLEPGAFPLGRAILGGRQLHRGDGYIVALVTKLEVPAVARALAAIDEPAMRARYERLVPRDYGSYGDDDRDYTAEHFLDVVDLYARAAADELAVIFTVDQ